MIFLRHVGGPSADDLAAVAILGHVAIPAYAIGWALMPEEGRSRSRAAEFLDSVATRVRQA